ncbi:MAG: hypothetical protein IIA81_06305 [Thaumarchaeota archaeon]|nr:hypothetical protein [Nitrososphaerota archaeon]
MGGRKVAILSAIFVTAILISSPLLADAARLPGAIFTTTPDGGIVNENVRYDQKIEVYLDGGPPPNAPAFAAGLPAASYVFQITDPSGKILLSEDPSKCRVVEISSDGVIVRLVPPSELTDNDGNNLELSDNIREESRNGKKPAIPCHIQDEPDGVAGPSARHDTNTDVDHFSDKDAIVVQMMPFFDTPNPGGVYKAWMIPLERYLDNAAIIDGDQKGKKKNSEPLEPKEALDKEPTPLKVKGNQVGFSPDSGFGPARDQIKTDNFKVTQEVVVELPMLHVLKFNDLNGDGDQDEGEPLVDGFPVSISEPLPDGAVTNDFATPVWLDLAVFGDYVIGEGICQVDEISGVIVSCDNFLDWQQSGVFVNGVSQGISNIITVNIPEGSTTDVTVLFGNFLPAEIHGKKFEDLNGNGEWNVVEPVVPDVIITLTGTDGMNAPVGPLSTVTNSDGIFWFMDLAPGSYTVTETVPEGSQPSTPTSVNVELESDEVVELGFIFGNFVPAEINGKKCDDLNGNGVCDEGEPGVADVTITLTGTDGMNGNVETTTTTDGSGVFSFDNLKPGEYTVTETVPTGTVASGPTSSGPHTIISGQVLELEAVFANFIPASIHGQKCNDLNGNGVCNTGEPGILDVTINLSGTDGKGTAVNDSTTTNSDGIFWFMDLAPGSYTVEEVVPDGQVDSSPISSGPHIIISGEKLELGAIFANIIPVDVHAFKFFDFNGNGIQDNGELPQAGVLICLERNGVPVTEDAFGESVMTCQESNSDGFVWWLGLVPGDFTVTEDLASSFTVGLTAVVGSGTVTLLSGENNDVTPVTLANNAACNGLTPGFWKAKLFDLDGDNQLNDFDRTQSIFLVTGTIADEGQDPDDMLREALRILRVEGEDETNINNSPIDRLAKFVLATQLTLKLTQNPDLPNTNGGSLFAGCFLDGNLGAGSLGENLSLALQVLSGDVTLTDAEINALKDILDAFANQNFIPPNL